MTLSERRHTRRFGDSGNDSASEFRRDCELIVNSAAFRRLGGVTQVVGVGETAVFHNRLTHSLKVAQVGRYITDSLQRRPEYAEVIERYGGLHPDVVHAAGLAHDLGHPPFGHIGEQALQHLLSGDPNSASGSGVDVHPQIRTVFELHDGFEGNAQTFRIVNKLEFQESYGGTHCGLNLTAATLAAISKYPWTRSNRPTEIGGSRRLNKWGCYETESAILTEFLGPDFIHPRAHEALSGWYFESRTLEAQIMDWSDDISYAVHDIEDFFRVGIVPLDSLWESDAKAAEFFDYAWKRIAGKLVAHDADDASKEAERAFTREVFDKVRGSIFPTAPYTGSPKDGEDLHKFASTVIKVAVERMELRDNGVLVPNKSDFALIEVLKQLTWYYVIDQPTLASMQHGQVYLLRGLFRDLVSLVGQEHKSLDRRRSQRRRLLPPRLAAYLGIAVGKDELGFYESDDERIRRAVVDYISSLTDHQAVDLYGRLHGLTPKSILDSWIHT